MKKLSFVFAVAVAAVLSSCGGSAVQSAAGVDVPSEVKVADAMIPMVTVLLPWARLRLASGFQERLSTR